jgi:hypothetical protein
VTLATESVTRVTPLGLRFVDEATGRSVRDGLDVRAARPQDEFDSPGDIDSSRRIVRAILNPSDVFVFPGLPGLRDVERGRGDAAFWASPPSLLEYRVRVSDRAGRFQPFSFLAAAPHRDLFQLPCVTASPPSSPPVAAGAAAVPLFSAPIRIAPAGLALIRAEIRDAASRSPAPFAMLEVTTAETPGPVGRSFADSEGRVLVVMPYPRPPVTTLPGVGSHPASPPAAAVHSLSAAIWALNITVRYLPDAAEGAYPDICSVLDQPPVNALATPSGTSFLSSASLAYGQELVLRTEGEHALLVS